MMGKLRKGVMLLVGLTIGFCAVRSEAASVNIQVLELRDRQVRIAILSGEAFDPKAVRKKGLVLGFNKQGRDGGFVKAKRLSGIKDVNGDGLKDRVAVFKLSEADADALRNGEAKQVEVRGIYKDGIFMEAFVARAVVGDSNDPTSDCAGVINEEDALIGQRCIWNSAANANFKPIDVQTLVGNLNSGLATSNLEIAQDSAVVIEAYGGHGAKGADAGNLDECGTAAGGSAGAAGYASTVLQVSQLPSSLWIYPGETGGVSGDRAGGAGTVVSSTNLTGLTDEQLGSTNVDDIVTLGILALAGGGGGGGDGHVTDDGYNCHHGGAGGQGGIAIAGTTGNASGTGSDGEDGKPGEGGSCSAPGAGGGSGGAGSAGIGGPGGESYEGTSGQGGGPLWAGWSSADNPVLTPTGWVFGAGGFNGNPGGRGGGGCGGGGSAKGDGSGHRGGGGGGGSVSAKATVAANTLQADLFYGQPNSSNGFTSQVVVTFQLQSKSE